MTRPTRFIVTGHVDHGKSTFIGRLLLEAGAIPRDRFENLKKEGRFEYAHLTDALAGEREKGITIGVSQTPFHFEGRDFILIDAPGHFEFLQNMITGAARADIAFFVVDANEGLKESSLRHLTLLSFLDVSRIVVLINKMDLVNYSEKTFLGLKESVLEQFRRLGLPEGIFIPVAAYEGENLARPSENMPWYHGPLALEALTGAVNPEEKKMEDRFLFSVHDVYGKFAVGELLGGVPREGDYLNFQSGERVGLKIRPEHYQGSTHLSFEVTSGAAKRGDLLAGEAEGLNLGDEMEINMIWFSNLTLVPGEKLRLRLAKQEVEACVSQLISMVDSARLQAPESELIRKGFVVKCRVRTSAPVAFTSFKKNAVLGRLVLLKDGLISGAGKVI